VLLFPSPIAACAQEHKKSSAGTRLQVANRTFPKVAIVQNHVPHLVFELTLRAITIAELVKHIYSFLFIYNKLCPTRTMLYRASAHQLLGLLCEAALTVSQTKLRMPSIATNV
jgi:hypothetical protein